MKKTVTAASIFVLATLSACGNSAHMSLGETSTSSSGLMTLQHSIGQGRGPNGERFDVLDGEFYVRSGAPSAACAVLFHQIDTALDTAMASHELKDLMTCYQEEGVMSLWGQMRDNGCSYEPSENDPALCSDLRAKEATARAACSTQEAAYSQLEEWTQAEAGMRSAIAASCYANQP